MLEVDLFIEKLPNASALIMHEVRKVILQCHPQIMESIKYKIPFYEYNGMFLYLSFTTKKRIYLGFVDGVEMSNQYGYLEHTTQKQIRHLYFDDVTDIESKCLREHLQEAIICRDEKRKKTKKTFLIANRKN